MNKNNDREKYVQTTIVSALLCSRLLQVYSKTKDIRKDENAKVLF